MCGMTVGVLRGTVWWRWMDMVEESATSVAGPVGLPNSRLVQGWPSPCWPCSLLPVSCCAPHPPIVPLLQSQSPPVLPQGGEPKEEGRRQSNSLFAPRRSGGQKCFLTATRTGVRRVRQLGSSTTPFLRPQSPKGLVPMEVAAEGQAQCPGSGSRCLRCRGSAGSSSTRTQTV